MTLRLDWCDHKAAEYAVLHWHYSHKMPAGKLVKVGVWEDEQFIGAVIFGRGGNNHAGTPYGLAQTEVCELVRVALWKHEAHVSRILAVALRLLKKQSPGLRLIVSYADPKQQHHGGIYQATGWTYAGPSTAQAALLVGGISMHKRTASSLYGTASPERITAITGSRAAWEPTTWKHTYLYPLDDKMRAQIATLAKPYPKRAPVV